MAHKRILPTPAQLALYALRVKQCNKLARGRRRDGYDIPIRIIHKEGDPWPEVDSLRIKIDDYDYRVTPVWIACYDDCHTFSDSRPVPACPEMTEAEWVKAASEDYLKTSAEDRWWGDEENRQTFRDSVDKYILELQQTVDEDDDLTLRRTT